MNAKAVTIDHIRSAAEALHLSGRPLCIHSSLRSFGWVAGGARTVIDGLLAAGCTVMVPTFSEKTFGVPPPPGWRLPQNGWDYDAFPGRTTGLGRAYDAQGREIDRDMGAIPTALLPMAERVRGAHPLDSFAAVGPLAKDLIGAQRPLDVYAPLRELASHDGAVVLMGVGLDTMTILHLAEQHAGRRLFRRWASGSDGRPVEVETGGCSQGFVHLEPVLAPLAREAIVGTSRWRAFPAHKTVDRAAQAIRRDPAITHCGKLTCERCNDAVRGGPLLAELERPPGDGCA